MKFSVKIAAVIRKSSIYTVFTFKESLGVMGHSERFVSCKQCLQKQKFLYQYGLIILLLLLVKTPLKMYIDLTRFLGRSRIFL